MQKLFSLRAFRRGELEVGGLEAWRHGGLEAWRHGVISLALLGFPGLSCALLGAPGLSCALLGAPGLSWALLGFLSGAIFAQRFFQILVVRKLFRRELGCPQRGLVRNRFFQIL